MGLVTYTPFFRFCFRLGDHAFRTITLCLCHVYIDGYTVMYSIVQCHMSRPTNAEINNNSCRERQESLRHVRGSVSKERSSLGHDSMTKCADMRFVCPQCRCALSTKCGLTEHVKHAHQKIARYKCQHCGKGYSQRNNYLDHLATHTGVKGNVCPVCQRQFTFKFN